jgi:hypothetical protein
LLKYKFRYPNLLFYFFIYLFYYYYFFSYTDFGPYTSSNIILLLRAFYYDVINISQHIPAYLSVTPGFKGQNRVHLIHAPKKTTHTITECIEINVTIKAGYLLHSGSLTKYGSN